ncbi:hypothetical protein Dsin_020771 [Dipteronia sinensis]|uniref:Uncharacterized protein n=1 Tax=Dipteronia sinensis TaxID=43782 RepID=A0AAE0E400_9ROSI|nr:hypothetical protein Dsin_020771 [Dipteronia sinensis]
MGVWQGVCPPKIELFVWQLLHGRVLVKKVLYRFSMQLDGSVNCPLYGESMRACPELCKSGEFVRLMRTGQRGGFRGLLVSVVFFEIINGRYAASFRKTYIGFHDSILAEILAIARACELCVSRLELTGKTMVIVSDSQVAVSWINNDGFGSIVHAQTIYSIHSVLDNGGLVSIVYGSRHSNSLADQLGKKGSRKNDSAPPFHISDEGFKSHHMWGVFYFSPLYLGVDIQTVSILFDLGRWTDPPTCARLKVIIHGLLRRIRDLEMRSLETNGCEGNDTSVCPVVANEEVSYRGGMRRNWFCVVVVAIGIVLFVGKKLLENM